MDLKITTWNCLDLLEESLILLAENTSCNLQTEYYSLHQYKIFLTFFQILMEIFNVLRLLQKKWYKFQDKDSQIYWILKSELVKAEFFRFFCLSINLPYYICIYAYLTRKHLSLITLYVYIYFDYCNINTSFSESSSLPHASSGQIVTQTTKWIT